MTYEFANRFTLIEEFFFVFGHNIIPVSYTHLDVYKRQVISSIGVGYDFYFNVDFVWFTVCNEKENP